MEIYTSTIKPYFDQGLDFALTWLMSPQAWVQFGILVVCYLLAKFLARLLVPRLTKLLTFGEGRFAALKPVGDFLIDFLPLLMPLLAFGMIGVGELVASGVFGSAAVLAFGKRIFIFVAVRTIVRDILKDPFLKLLGRLILVPIAFFYVLGINAKVAEFLKGVEVPLGNLAFDLLWLIQLVGIGGFVFWLGSWSNARSAGYITESEEMKPATRQLAAKAAEIAIYGFAFLMVMNIMQINLSAFAILGGAIGVGLGFGLQKIASNFISGVILLLEGQATVGDFVELDGGEAGTIVKMTARAAILETFDGRWIVVPNEDFIVTRVVNYSDSGSANRFEAPFSVSYDTDINLIPGIVEAAVASHPEVLDKPFPPDCELRAFGDSGVEFAVEFWVNGLDDGKNKFTSDVLFLVWNALKDNDIEIPYPQRVVHHKGLPPS